MRTLIVIMNHFLKLTFINKLSYVLFFVAPIAAFILMSMVFGRSDAGNLSIGYINEDTGVLGTRLMEHLGKNRRNSIQELPETKIREKLLDGSIALSMGIPADFSETINERGTPSIRIFTIQGETVSSVIRNDINRFIAGLIEINTMSGNNTQLRDTLYEDFLTGGYTVELREVSDTNVKNSAGTIGFGYILFIILVQVSVITRLMLKEKENRTFMRIRIAPVRELYYTLGNMFASFMIIGAQIVISILILTFVLRYNLTIPALPAIILLLSFSIAAIGLGIMVTSFARSTAQADIIMNFFVVVSCMLSGSFWSNDFMPGIFKRIAAIFPQTWVIQAIEKMQSGASFVSIGAVVPLLLAFGLFFVCIYAYNMRYSQNQEAAF